MSKRIGAAITLKVMAGDKVDIGVKAWYKQYTGEGLPIKIMTQDMLGVLTATLGGQAAAVSGGKATPAELQAPGSPVGVGLQDFLNGHNDPPESGRPLGYLNWMLLDEQFNYVPGGSGFIRVGSYTAAMQTLARNGLPL
jgi:hypothetical protein